MAKNNGFQPIVDCDVSLEVELSMTELDHRKSGSAERLYFVYTRNALPQNGCNKLQNFNRSGSGQVNVRQNGVFRMAILGLIFSCLLKLAVLDILQIDVNRFIIWLFDELTDVQY